MSESAVVEQEATSDFNQRCLQVAQSWQHGDLPFTNAITQLLVLAEEAEQSEHVANLARVQHLLGYMQHYRGNLDTGLRHYERARTLYERIGNLRRAAVMDLNMGESYRYKGDFPRARRLFQAAYAIATEMGDARTRAMAISNEGQVLLSLNHYEQARAALEKGAELTLQMIDAGDNADDLPTLLCEVSGGLVVIYLAEERFQAAWETAKRALDIAYTGQQPMQLGFANRAVGEVLTLTAAPPDAHIENDPDYYFRAASQAFREINMEGEIAKTMLAHAHSLAQRGKCTTAARKLQQVMIIFTKLGMLGDAARAAELQRTVL
jgi:tetratricopeptide (TPR) repeat protein